MKRSDYILLYTKSILTLPDSLSRDLLEEFGVRFELNEPAKPGAVSIASRRADGTHQDYRSWIKELRAKKVQAIRVAHVSQDSDLPEHIAAAFAGSQELLMQITTAADTTVYYLQSYFSPYYEMTTDAFIQLIDSQPQRHFLWTRIAQHVGEFNEMNQRASFDPEDIQDYLKEAEGKAAFETLASQLLTEVQVECILAGTPMQVPEALAAFLYKSDAAFFEADTNTDPVYLYAIADVNAEDLLCLVEAQQIPAADIWNALHHYLKTYPEFSVPGLKPSEWPGYIMGRPQQELDTFASAVCQSICRLCEETGTPRVLPDTLLHVFGPDKEEHKRAKIRSRLGNDQWLLKSNEQPWELNVFEALEEVTELPDADYASSKNDFEKALAEVAAFAKNIHSPFYEAFALSLYLLKDEAPAGAFDEDHLLRMQEDLREKGFSENALEHLADAFYYGSDLKRMNAADDKAYGIIACSLADVFGGMGSWNDVYMETEEEQQQYQEVSAAVFSALNQYGAALLSQ